MKKIVTLLSFVFLVFLSTYSVFAQTEGTNSSILFSPTTISTKANESFTTQLWLDTDQAKVGGIDAKLIFDPKLLSIVKIDTIPVFPDYPATVFDNSNGTAHISGIVRSKDELYSGKSQFAAITWKAISSGEGTITLSFTAGATNDSNIAVPYGNGDILSTVNSISVRSAAVAQANEVSAVNEVKIADTLSASQSSFPIFEIVLSVIITLSIASHIYLHLRLRKIEKLREPIPQLFTHPE